MDKYFKIKDTNEIYYYLGIFSDFDSGILGGDTELRIVGFNLKDGKVKSFHKNDIEFIIDNEKNIINNYKKQSQATSKYISFYKSFKS